MKQTRIRVTCDACAAWHESDNEVGVETVPVGSQTLDLCPSHRSDLAPFLALVAEWGAMPEKGRKAARWTVTPAGAPDPVPAPEQPSKPRKQRGGARARARREKGAQAPLALLCPMCSSELANSDSLSTHLRAMHQTTGQAVYGGTCPVCNHAGTARGLGSHANMGHQVGSVAALFALAQSQGDPHGVIAARAQALAQQSS